MSLFAPFPAKVSQVQDLRLAFGVGDESGDPPTVDICDELLTARRGYSTPTMPMTQGRKLVRSMRYSLTFLVPAVR